MSYNITRKQAIERAPLLKAWGEGKKLQYNSGYGWHDCAEMHGILDDPKVEYRIKPEPKLRPWKPEEVPVGALLKYKSTIAIISFVNTEGFGFTQYMPGGGNNSDTSVWGFYRVFDTIEHSLDHGKTWLPCGVMEEV